VSLTDKLNPVGIEPKLVESSSLIRLDEAFLAFGKLASGRPSMRLEARASNAMTAKDG
jgi:hypothetical protein